MLLLFMACTAPDVKDAAADDTAETDARDSAEDTGETAEPPDDTGPDDTARVDADADGFRAGLDCDDADAQVHPAAVDVCHDGVDQDCDGADATCLGQEVAADADGAAVVCHGTAAWPASTLATIVGDVDGDGVGELFLGTYLDSRTETEAGAAWLVHGPVVGTVDQEDAPVKVYGEDASDWLGRTLADAGDTDGDGLTDLLIGADGVGEDDAGAAYLFARVTDGRFGASDATAMFAGEAGDRLTGARSAGDVDGDGLADVLTVAGEGVVYLSTCPCAGTLSVADADARWTSRAGLRFAWGAGDLDGDGAPDLLVAGDDRSVALLSAAASGLVDADAAALATIPAISDEGGPAIDIGDLDGDGAPDLALSSFMGSPRRYQEGEVRVYAGPLAGALGAEDAMATLRSDVMSGWLGYDVGVGDFDGDGVDDLVTGAPALDPADEDATGVVGIFGPIAGNHTAAAVDVTVLGGNGAGRLGWEIALGDLDGDGIADLAAESATNIVHVLYGGPR